MKTSRTITSSSIYENSYGHAENTTENQKESEKVAEALSCFLASTYTLCQKALFYHWNVAGTHFVSLHKLFQEQYESLLKTGDIIAGHLRALGHYVPSTPAEFSDLSAIKEDSGAPFTGKQMIDNLLTSHEICSQEARKILKTAEEAKDYASMDFMFHRMAFHSKAASMLRAMQV